MRFITIGKIGRYLFALGCVAVATALRYLLDAALPGLVPFATFFPAVVAAGFFAGIGACMVAAVASVLAAWYFFISPVQSWTLLQGSDAVNLVLFVIGAGITGVIGALLRERILAAKRAEARLRRAQNTGGVADWEWNVDTGEVLWSESFFSLLGIAPYSAPAGADTLHRAMHADDQQRMREIIADAVRTLDKFDAEFRVVHPDGSLHWLATRAEAVRDPDGMRRVVGVVIDVTKRKEAELQREMMFHELNHRVKNNFQIVGSMLRLQAARVRDATARGHLDGAVQRVMTVADVHSALYQSGHIDTLDLGKYLTSLCRKLQTSLMASTRVSLDLETVPAVFKVDRAIPLGLIANELITNAVKHAFPEGRAGRVTVRLTRHNDGYILSISDDGIGMAENNDGSHDGLGMRMVEAFVDQANGHLKVRRYAGTHFEIELPDETSRSAPPTGEGRATAATPARSDS